MVAAEESAADDGAQPADGDAGPVAPRGGGPGDRRPKVELPEPEPDEGPTYYRLGIDHEFGADDEEIHFQCTRIRKIENLEAVGPRLKKLCLIANCVEKIENLETTVNLEHLELYQNLVKKIENISHLTSLTVLDLSFNRIRSPAPLSSCPFNRLEKLYLSSNKIMDIEGVFHLTALKMLEFGCNRIRSIPPALGSLVNLEELWLGKNKIVSMALPPLPNLRHISLQNNRLEAWDPSFFTSARGVTHLYLGHNNLPNLPQEFGQLRDLVEVDLAKNAISSVTPLAELTKLEELWMNDNQIEDLAEVQNLQVFAGSLQTVYLERNPMHGLGDAEKEARYKDAILAAVPNLRQLDAEHLNQQIVVKTDGAEKTVIGIMKA